MKKTMRSPQRGQTLVEFALILPVFLFLSLMIFDFGRAVYYYNAIHNAARAGARYGVIHPKTTDYPAIQTTAINNAVGLGLTPANVGVGLGTPENVGGESNPTIKVTVTYTFKPVTPLVANFLPCGCSTLTIRSEAVMRTEAKP